MPHAPPPPAALARRRAAHAHPQIATKVREDLEALKKVRAHRGLRHYWGIKVRGQHTGTTGRGRSHAMAAAAAQGK